MVIRIRSLGAAGAEYQSLMIVPPNGSAECSGINEMVSRLARQRKELTPSVTCPPAEEEIAVEPVELSSISIAVSEPHAASQSAAATTVTICIEVVLPAVPTLHSFGFGRLYWRRCRGATLAGPNGWAAEPLTSDGQRAYGGDT